MSNTDKHSKKSSSNDDTLLYVLLFLLVALLVGGLIYWQWSTKTEPNYDYSELGEWTNSPTQEEVSKLFANNRDRIKSAERILNDKIKSKRLSSKEKEEVRAEMKKINQKLYKDLQGHDLKKIEKESPEMLATLYAQLYEDGKTLVRIKEKTSTNRPYEEVKKQQELQKRWKKTFASQWNDIVPKMNGWLIKWHHQARELIPKHGKFLTRGFIPFMINGREANPNSEEDINYFLNVNNNEEKGGWEENVAFLSQPPIIHFEGYGGFVKKKELKESSEGSETFGLTTCNKAVEDGWGIPIPATPTTPAIPALPTRTSTLSLRVENDTRLRRNIVITLSKKLFLNRLGYEEWITSAKKEKNSRNYWDICFESAAETIIHELAHSIVDVMIITYDGEEGGGHGKLFYEIMEDIEKMVRETPEFREFEEWWKSPEKEEKEWAAASILGDNKKSHWDEWKYWYIGGGVGILVIGLVVVVIFWDTSKKKNGKN